MEYSKKVEIKIKKCELLEYCRRRERSEVGEETNLTDPVPSDPTVVGSFGGVIIRERIEYGEKEKEKENRE